MSLREAKDDEKIEKAEWVYRRIGPAMEHNYYCAVCKQNAAVQDCSTGILEPCWECQDMGYRIVRKSGFFKKLFRLQGEDHGGL